MKITNLKIPECNIKINIQDEIFSIGSCFSNEISNYLKKNGIFILSNPFGTIYNSYSILNVFKIIFGKKEFNENDLCYEQNKYFSLFHSTDFDSNSKDQSYNRIKENIDEVSLFIKKTNVFIITAGTSVVYLYKKNGEITANCHKLSDILFEKKILNVEENILNFKQIINLIKENNINAKIIFTLSPIRHTPNNLVENQFSKSILRTALENLKNIGNVYYFPSYEIVLDELRDYKYYKNDGLHLKKNTINKIMDKFKDSFFDIKINNFIDEFNYCKKIRKHRTKDNKSNGYFELLKKVIIKLIGLYKIKKSVYIEKEIYINCKRLIKNYYDKKEVEDFLNIQLNDIDDLKKLLIASFKINNNLYSELNDEDFIYENKFIKNLKNFILKVKSKYYYNKDDFKKSAEILLKL